MMKGQKNVAFVDPKIEARRCALCVEPNGAGKVQLLSLRRSINGSTTSQQVATNVAGCRQTRANPAIGMMVTALASKNDMVSSAKQVRT